LRELCSATLNVLFVCILDPVWSTHIMLPKLQHKVVKLCSIYANNVAFDNAMACHTWEVALEPNLPEESMAKATTPLVLVPAPAKVPEKLVLNVKVVHSISTWSNNTLLDLDVPMVFASPAKLDPDLFLKLQEQYIFCPKLELLLVVATVLMRLSMPVGTWHHQSSNPSLVSATMPTWLHAASNCSTQSNTLAHLVVLLPPTPCSGNPCSVQIMGCVSNRYNMHQFLLCKSLKS
jgi:hypothetical protein